MSWLLFRHSILLEDRRFKEENKQVCQQKDEFKATKKIMYVQQQRMNEVQILVISENTF